MELNDQLRKVGIAVGILLALFLLVSTINQIKAFGYIGKSPNYQNSLPVTGKGEVFAVPDIASFTFTINESAATIGEAQKKATEKNNAALDYLKGEGIVGRDVQTVGYNTNPKYEYNPTTGKQTQVGIEVSQSVSVKVREAEKAGDILAGIAELEVSNVSGLNFTVDDEDSLKREARDMAIEDARDQAEKVADQLGIRLGKVIGFYENEGYPYPMYEGLGGDMAKSAVAQLAPSRIELGERKITSQVSITFEILD